MKIKIYGSRGTLPYFNRNNTFFGGNTSCIRVDAGHVIILDCGSGLAQFYDDIGKKTISESKIDILLSHIHLDHIIGLTTFGAVWEKNNNISIYTRSRDGRSITAQVFGLFKPPYWPVDLEQMCQARMVEINDAEPFMLEDGIKVIPFASAHQDKTTAFRIEDDKTLVYLLDYEVGGDQSGAFDNNLVEFCRDADAIIFDSCFLPGEYEKKRGWGHSTYLDGIKLAELSSCKQMILCHFNQDYSDVTLHTLENEVKSINKSIVLAYDGMELEI